MSTSKLTPTMTLAEFLALDEAWIGFGDDGVCLYLCKDAVIVEHGRVVYAEDMAKLPEALDKLAEEAVA